MPRQALGARITACRAGRDPIRGGVCRTPPRTRPSCARLGDGLRADGRGGIALSIEYTVQRRTGPLVPQLPGERRHCRAGGMALRHGAVSAPTCRGDQSCRRARREAGVAGKAGRDAGNAATAARVACDAVAPCAEGGPRAALSFFRRRTGQAYRVARSGAGIAIVHALRRVGDRLGHRSRWHRHGIAAGLRIRYALRHGPAADAM